MMKLALVRTATGKEDPELPQRRSLETKALVVSDFHVFSLDMMTLHRDTVVMTPWALLISATDRMLYFLKCYLSVILPAYLSFRQNSSLFDVFQNCSFLCLEQQ